MESGMILIVDDEPQIRRYLRTTLKTQGFEVLEAINAQECESLAASHRPDVILLDLGLPDLDGIDLARKLREWCNAPIIVISARGQEEDKIRGLDAGADDYLTKPFLVGELLARIRSCLRRSSLGEQDQPVFQTGELRVDLSARRVFIKDEEVRLTPIEYKLLTEFVRHAGKVLTHRHLLKEVWNIHNMEQVHCVRIFVHQLRQKIEKNSARPRYILGEAGVGYRLKAE